MDTDMQMFLCEVYVAFLITERAVIVYVKAEASLDPTEEDMEYVIEGIVTQFQRSGVPLAEPVDGILLDSIPHPHRSIAGTVPELIYKINRGEI